MQRTQIKVFISRLPSKVVILQLFMVIGINGQNDCGELGPRRLPFMTNSSITHHWPWHAAIFHKADTESAPTYECGGTLIASDSILTAAHCVSNYNELVDAELVTISLGRLNLGVNEISDQTFQVDEIVLHPNYSAINHINDIAIVRLLGNATFNDFVQPICLWKVNETELSVVEGRKGTVVGWGLTETGQLSKVLRKASLPVIPRMDCLESKPHFFGPLLSVNNFCAGLHNGTSVCLGDSGGSMAFEENGIHYIRGIVSVSQAIVNLTSQTRTCNSMEYAIFTDVAQYLPWITDVAAIVCKIIVRCKKENNKQDADRDRYPNRYSYFGKCIVENVNTTATMQECKWIFNETSNANVTMQYLQGWDFKILPDLSDGIAKFKNVKKLWVTRTHLETIPRSRLTVYKEITELFLEGNKIAQLDSDTFNDLKNLTTLSLSGNYLNEVSSDLFKELQHLNTLVLNYNKIKTLPADLFEGLYNLATLNINFNNIEVLPPHLFQDNKKLNVLSLQGNFIAELDENIFSGLHELRHLTLSRNYIKTISANHFRDNKNLKSINFRYNDISRIDFDFRDFPSLTEADFLYNVCTDMYCLIHSLCGTSSLTELNYKFFGNCTGHS